MFLFASTIFNFLAIRKLQLAEAMSIAFATPFLIAVLSGPILGEWIGVRRWIAILVGFSGVVVVTRPGMAGFDPAIFWAFGSVLCYAGYSITTRILTGVDSTASMLVISAAIPVLMLSPLMPVIWVTPSGGLAWGLMGLMGLMGAVGHFFLIRAYAHAPAPVVAPFIYTQIIWATAIGYVAFGDTPGLNTVVGAGIVIASGLYLIYRETIVTGRVTPPPASTSAGT
jgi:drug/metabolite transporter (DMT)-like permease